MCYNLHEVAAAKKNNFITYKYKRRNRFDNIDNRRNVSLNLDLTTN